MRVGFIGLGSQGGPDGTPDRRGRLRAHVVGAPACILEPYADTAAKDGAPPRPSSARPATWCVCASSATTMSGRCCTARAGVLAGMAAGGIVAIHSTVHPDTCREIAEKAAAQGVSVIDAPVSGGGPAVEAGHAAGDGRRRGRRRREGAGRCSPRYADPIVHLGPLGSGQVAKILNNLLFSANLGSADEHPGTGRVARYPARPARARYSTAVRPPARRSAASRCSAEPWRGWRPIAGALLQKDVRHAASLAGAKRRRPRARCSTRPMRRWRPWINPDERLREEETNR